LAEVDAGKFLAKEIPMEQIRQVALHEDDNLNALVRKHWGKIDGGTPEERLADIRRFNNDLRAFGGDATRGREMFLKTCGVCHAFFGEGQSVGPDLTHSNRHDRDYLLTSVVDPSVVIRKEFLSYNIELTDGRVLSGLISEQAGNGITLVSGQNEKVTIGRGQIASMQESQVSLMPEGLLHALSPQELRDLFAYLQHENPAAVKKAPMEKRKEGVRISEDGKGFVVSSASKPFVPVGFNYDRDYKMRLLEDYWQTEWSTVAEDFGEMKTLGANVVRVHLQFSKFMDAADKPNAQALGQLKKLLILAEETGLYLDLTGLASYRKSDIAPWYRDSAETARWTAQANFWEAIAQTCAGSPAVFCFNLINEPVVPTQKREDWLVGSLAGFYYVEAITLDPAGRKRSDIARQWIKQMSAAIRKYDKEHLITVGLLPNSADEPSSSGFVPKEIGPEVDYFSVHLYPRTGKLQEDIDTLRKFAIGKPLVIEETFAMHCSTPQLREFLQQSRTYASGWIGFYWGQTPGQLRDSKKYGELVMRDWLGLFQETVASVSQFSPQN
jgi:putative heme-binding domain-containing protein